MKRSEVIRRRKIRKFWADPKNRDAHSKRLAQVMGTPERRRAQSEVMKRRMAEPKHRKAQSNRMKRVMNSPKRRKVQSEIMLRNKANPEFEARRLAGYKKGEASPERKAQRRDTLRKMLALPANRRRRAKNSKKASTTPQYRAAMSAKRKKWWDDLRARLDGPTGTTKTRNRRGRPRMDEKYERAAELYRLGWKWRDIAREVDMDFAKDTRASIHRVRMGTMRLLRSKK